MCEWMLFKSRIKMERCGLQGLRLARPQTFQVPLGGDELGAAQLDLFGNQPSRLVHIARHEYGERDPEVLYNALVE
jgi:hypothetical protein